MKAIIAPLFVLCNFISIAQSPFIELKSETGPITPPVGYFKIVHEDSSTIGMITSLASDAFTRRQGRYGFARHGTDRHIWLYFPIQNLTTVSQWYLVMDNPLLDDIHLYNVRDNVLKEEYHCGEKLSFGLRPVKNGSFVFPLHLVNEEPSDLYIRIDMNGRAFDPYLMFMAPQAFHVWHNQKSNQFFLFIGIMLLLSVMNGYLCWVFKDRVFLWLSLYIGAQVFTWVCIGGYGSQYLWPDWPELGEKLPGVITCMSIFFIIGFCRQFLMENLPKILLQGILLILMAVAAILALLSFLEGNIQYITVWVMYKMLLVAYLTLLFTVIVVIRKQRTAMFLFVGMVSLILVLSIAKWVPSQSGYILTSGPAMMALAVGCLFLSFSMMDRLKVLKEYEKEIKVTQERERISRDLHDNIGSYLTHLNQNLHRIAREVPLTVSPQIQHLQRTVRDSVRELRETIWAIQKEEVTLDELEEKVHTLFWNYRQADANVIFDLKKNTNGSAIKLKPGVAINLYRIIQEAVQNSVKHSEAQTIEVSINLTQDNSLSISIVDDGKGFSKELITSADHHGLVNMRKRASELKSVINIDSQLNEGTEISVNYKV